MIKPCQQLALLLEEGIDTQGHTHTLASLAAKSGVSDQALANLLSGKTGSPRLLTVRAICAVYGLSIDYFDLDTERACRLQLEQHRRAQLPLIAEIAHMADQLSPDDQQSLNTVIRWIRADGS